MTYETLANFAATYGTVYMLILFLLTVAWVYRPQSKKTYDKAAHIPLQED